MFILRIVKMDSAEVFLFKACKNVKMLKKRLQHLVFVREFDEQIGSLVPSMDSLLGAI